MSQMTQFVFFLSTALEEVGGVIQADQSYFLTHTTGVCNIRPGSYEVRSGKLWEINTEDDVEVKTSKKKENDWSLLAKHAVEQWSGENPY